MIRKLNLTILIILAVFSALAEKASIETSVQPTMITIGDYITYQVIITHEKGIDIIWPGAAAELGQFQIVDFETSEPEEIEEGKLREILSYYISTYDIGEWTIPPTGIAYYDSAQDTTIVLRTEPIKITVKSLLSEEDWAKINSIAQSDTSLAGMEKQIAAGRILQMAKEELLRDITSPEKLKRNLKFWIGIGVIIIVIASLVICYLLWRKRKGIKGAIFSLSAPELPPHEAALAEIAALLAKDYISNREFKIFYSRLSDILRIYLEASMGVMALELSTSETIDNIERSTFPILLEDMDLLKNILERCDLVKFAKLIPPDDWHMEIVESVRDLIDHTKPIEPEPEENISTTEEHTSPSQETNVKEVAE